ncbi:prepilin-type N-terminal cleavage/methylation domain-containing protein [Metaplanococcus flavidus]|uniref:Prepilin-type N-terminal cleavage/methylation domain-containing protein n=1 Tax=Metaplanococcus flavidus TaxID=569883 RepID=A0ABW3L8R0_9BACL
MKKFMQKKLKNEKGMTLIELLAVIVILAIIAAIAVPAISGIIENSRVGAVKSDAINIINAAELYDTEAIPGDEVSLAQLETAGFIKDAGSFAGLTTDEKDDVKVNLTNNALTGTNKELNGITITFSAATKAIISSYPNSTRGSGDNDLVFTIGPNPATED